ncbi:MAG TPA: adenylyltransferase/cytidyltransferase family protein [Candidatus Tyrphobacter sp.]
MGIEPFFGQLLDLEAAVAWREEQRATGRCIVFTNGCFDVLHAGHVEFLAWARSQGDALIVGLNDDDSVARLKGPRRPILRFEQRARLLRALRSVDVVVGFAERTPEALIDRIRPDVHTKSAQYREDELPERTVVLQHGGVIRLAPHESGNSTTETIARILARYGSS